MKKSNIGHHAHKVSPIVDLLFVIAGAAVFGAGLNAFLLPNAITVGGASGIASLINHFTPIPVGLLILAINVPLLILCIRQTGLRSMFRTVIGTVAVALSSDAFAFLFDHINLPLLTDDLLLAAALGGGAMGLGSGIMMLRGYTSGGSDLVAYLVHRKIPRIPTGKTILAVDIAVITATAISLESYGLIIYCMISSAVYGFAIDYMMRGANDCRLAMIISSKHEQIAKNIADVLDRGVTELDGHGWYTGEDRTVLMCVVRRREEFALRRVITSTDPKAFVVMTTSCEAIGDGFASQ